jgi:DnaJ domain
MQAFLLGMVLLFITLWGLNRYTQANPAALSRRLTKSWGYTSLIVGAILTLRGGAALGIPLATFGAWLLGWGPGSSMGSPTPTLGQSTSVTTDYLEMQIDHDSGAMSGRVIKGLFAGRTLESLRPESARILEAYLDRIHPNWRQDMADGEAEMTTSRGGRMRRDEALEILGLQEGATADDIRQAHRELMKKIHPDRGGSTYLATKINEAKDVLLG